jgi:histidine triad (HIT) family protein
VIDLGTCRRNLRRVLGEVALYVRRLFTRLARSKLGGRVVHWTFVHMAFAVPVERLRETETLLAFYHPQPSYALHILLVSKRPFSSLMDVPPGDGEFVYDLFEMVQSLVRELDLEQRGYRLIANGGTYQEVPHLHFHLVAD